MKRRKLVIAGAVVAGVLAWWCWYPWNWWPVIQTARTVAASEG